MLFSALVMRYVSEKSTSNKCGKQVFSVLASAYFRGPVNLKYTIYPSTSTPNISQYCMMFGSITFCLYTICTHHGPTNFSGMKMANNCKSLQSKWLHESKENKSIHRLDLPGSTGLGGGSCPPCPPLLVTPLLTILRYFQTTKKGKVFQTTYQARLALALSIISTSANPAGKPWPTGKILHVHVTLFFTQEYIACICKAENAYCKGCCLRNLSRSPPG